MSVSTPKRIQMSRQRPWRADNPDAVIVARPSKWGNPFRAGEVSDVVENRGVKAVWIVANSQDAVDLFRKYHRSPEFVASVRAELAGRDLACWCALDQPCHADVLLELANGGA